MDLLEADFQGANLYESNFQGADLEGVKFDGTDLSDVNLDKVRNFTQDQLNTIIYQFEYPPKNLTELDLPEHRAFTYNDTDQRVFITSEYSESDQLVDEVLEEEQQELEKTKASKKI